MSDVTRRSVPPEQDNRPPTAGESRDKWLKRLQQVMDDAPEGIWLYAASGTLYVMSLGPDGDRLLTPEGDMDQSAILASIRTPQIDGGDW